MTITFRDETGEYIKKYPEIVSKYDGNIAKSDSLYCINNCRKFFMEDVYWLHGYWDDESVFLLLPAWNMGEMVDKLVLKLKRNSIVMIEPEENDVIFIDSTFKSIFQDKGIVTLPVPDILDVDVTV